MLEVLLKKARTIRERLGIAVPVPVGSEQVVNALVDSVLLRRRGQERQLSLALEDASVSRLHEAWDQVAEKEQRTRAFFAQHQIKPDDVALELKEIEPVLGSTEDIRRFMANAMQRFNGEVQPTKTNNVFQLNPGDLRDRIVAREGRIRFPLSVTFNGIAAPEFHCWEETTPALPQRQKQCSPKPSREKTADFPGPAPYSPAP